MSRQAFGVLLKGISAVFMAPNWNAGRRGSGQETKAFTALMPMHTQEAYLCISQTTIQFSYPDTDTLVTLKTEIYEPPPADPHS